MKIESLIRRAKGSRVRLDAPTVHYHFKPTETDPRHLAEVFEKSHIAALLRIREAFAPADDSEDEQPNPQGEQKPDLNQFERVLVGSNVHNATYIVKGGDEIALGELVEMAFEDSGLDEAQWNDLADQERYEFIDRVLAELQGKTDEDDAPPPPPAPQDDTAPPPAAQQTDTPPPPPEGKSEENTEADKAKERDHWAAEYKLKFNREPNKRMTAVQLKRAVENA